MFSKSSLFVILFICAFLTRFVGLAWGGGFYFHPDENNMASAVSRLQIGDLNPHFFAYGQFPLYLGFFTLKALSVATSFNNAVFVLRFWSAIFSVASILLVYYISRHLFSQKFSLAASFLTIFNPGLIQMAHFGTTESFLIFVFLSNIYLSIKIVSQPKKYLFFLLAGLISGLGIATKISSLIFLGPPLLASFVLLFKSPKKRLPILGVFLMLLVCLLSFVAFSPYNLLQFSDFISSMKYETEVASGQLKVFYTTQFSGTTPYIFQLTRIFPYVSGLPQFLFGLIGLIIFAVNIFSRRLKNNLWVYILFPSLVYFLYFGQLYVKWTRFMSPLYFLFPLFTVYFISRLKSKYLQIFFIFVSCLPGIYFFQSLYLHPDIRITASRWLNTNLPENSPVLSEGGNVVDIPLFDNQLRVKNYDFYNYHSDEVVKLVENSEYIIVPSRRVFKNYNYDYHRLLFNNLLGFTKIKEFSQNPDIILNSENAEETWSVFDHPTIRIYQKTSPRTLNQYEQLFQN